MAHDCLIRIPYIVLFNALEHLPVIRSLWIATTIRSNIWSSINGSDICFAIKLSSTSSGDDDKTLLVFNSDWRWPTEATLLPVAAATFKYTKSSSAKEIDTQIIQTTAKRVNNPIFDLFLNFSVSQNCTNSFTYSFNHIVLIALQKSRIFSIFFNVLFFSFIL